MGLPIIVMAICLVLAIMLLEVGMNGVELGVHILSGNSNDHSKLLVR